MKCFTIVAALVLTVCGLREAGAGYIAFRWLSSPSTALNSGGTSLASGQTLLTFVSSDTNISWSGTSWTDGDANNTYGALAAGGDYFLYATNTVSSGTYTVGATFTQNPSSYATYHAYVVLLDYSFANFVANNYQVPDGTTYDILSSSWYLRDSPTPSQNFLSTEILQTVSTISVVPEPTTIALVATGMGVVLIRRRRKQTASVESE